MDPNITFKDKSVNCENIESDDGVENDISDLLRK